MRMTHLKPQPIKLSLNLNDENGMKKMNNILKYYFHPNYKSFLQFCWNSQRKIEKEKKKLITLLQSVEFLHKVVKPPNFLSIQVENEKKNKLKFLDTIRFLSHKINIFIIPWNRWKSIKMQFYFYVLNAMMAGLLCHRIPPTRTNNPPSSLCTTYPNLTISVTLWDYRACYFRFLEFFPSTY